MTAGDPRSPAPRPGGFDRDVASLATAIEDRAPLVIEEVPETLPRRGLYWIAGGLCALLIGAAEVGILMQVERSEAARAAAAARPLPPTAPCAERLTAIMDAIDAYAAVRGAPPPNLEILHPAFLAFAPVDPARNAPYAYRVTAEGISLACPGDQPG